MSAQGATLGGRGKILHLPIWPVAVLVTAVAAVAIGVSMIGEQNREFTRPFGLSGQAANSTTALREGGVVIPAIDPSVGWTSTTAIRETGVTIPATVGISHVTPRAVSEGFSGFENPGAYVIETPAYPRGLEYPGAYQTGSTNGTGGTNPCPAACQLARR